LQHRHIVRVDDLLQLGGRWALLMEYIAGLDIETLITRARASGVTLPPRAVMQICAATAAALDSAFAAVGDDGAPLFVVHRDIKPSNVRLSQTGEVKVLDFGIARADFAGREAKSERVRYGSLGYMAPERVLGEPETAAGDVYSLGVMLYELLTLESYGRAELAPDKQLAQVKLAVDRVRTVAGDEIAAIVASALAYEGSERPSAKTMEGVLRRSAATLPGDDVEDFAIAKFGGLAAEDVPTEPDGADGIVLHEGTSSLQMPHSPSEGGRFHSTALAPRPSATLAISDILPLPPLAPDEPPRRRSPVVALAAAAGLLVILLNAGVRWQAQRETSGEAAVQPEGPEAEGPEAEGRAVGSGGAPLPPETSVSPVVVATAPSAPSTPSASAAVPSLAAASGPPRATGAGAAARTPVTPPSAAAATPKAALSSPPPAAMRLRAAKFVLTGGNSISATCGDVTASGATNALVRDFVAGTCSVVADGYKTTISLESPRQVDCTLAGGALSCR
ncbi:MAG: serine/threonine protein kinase, partial [Myxococcales bacterium]|nr:serine/threonine protein kinase [Myxococcales bacterium]